MPISGGGGVVVVVVIVVCWRRLRSLTFELFVLHEFAEHQLPLVFVSCVVFPAPSVGVVGI